MAVLRKRVLPTFPTESEKKLLAELNVVISQQMWLQPVSEGTLEDVINRRMGDKWKPDSFMLKELMECDNKVIKCQSRQ